MFFLCFVIMRSCDLRDVVKLCISVLCGFVYFYMFGKVRISCGCEWCGFMCVSSFANFDIFSFVKL